MHCMQQKAFMWTTTGLPVMVVMLVMLVTLGTTLNVTAMPGDQDQWLCEDCLDSENF